MGNKEVILKIKGIVENTPSPDLDNYCDEDVTAMDNALSNIYTVITELEKANDKTSESGLDLHVVNGWRLIHYCLQLPLDNTEREKRFGKPIDSSAHRNCFKHQCIYKHIKTGKKIFYAYNHYSKEPKRQYDIYACR